MIKREPTTLESFRNWMNTRDDSFFSKLFEAIDKSNLTQRDKLRESFPEHVAVYEEHVDKQQWNSLEYKRRKEFESRTQTKQ